MADDNCSTVSPPDDVANFSDSSTTKQRKKRKWDQPAESLVSMGLAIPGILPVGNMASLAGASLYSLPLVSGSPSFLAPNSATTQQVFQAPLVQQLTTALIPKQKIQDELIAREIVINDAEPLVRYKLTKRQAQEEIQRGTGAVVITRGKYRPPNAPNDGERPLYLHISAGAHLETTVDRIKAVDRAASMVEEMLKNGSAGSVSTLNQPLSTSVYLGFEADPSLNIAARIRGPNDQYVNHITNETGATVVLRGRGSGTLDVTLGEEGQQPLHLFLSSTNQKSLESAKFLAENLLATISQEFGATRLNNIVSSSNVYGAVPPPQHLLPGGLNPINLVPSVVSSLSVGPNSVVPSQPHVAGYPQHSLTGGTSYAGYGGIYPQATPLQQVALALRQSPSVASSTVTSPALVAAMTGQKSESSSSEERRPPQKRKFKELPLASKGLANLHQQVELQRSSEFLKPKPSRDFGVRNISTMPPPKELGLQSSNGTMVPPPPRAMRPPPPPPKFNASLLHSKKVQEHNNVIHKTKPETTTDTLLKLVEYGDEDDDEDDDLDKSTELSKSNSSQMVSPKPFWAI
ncbi:protein RIK [Impatiens glandulifera]|uniref:protein RIK n=1 Tax=Impatiens glandulifera TaxID=253017 RepID=UPI001FB108CD|nr:protein RIK [Impatiens glandulifera]